MSMPFQPIRTLAIKPEGLVKKSYLLSPNDIFYNYARVTLAYPLFFDYDISGDAVVAGTERFLKKWTILGGRIRPDPHTRYVVEVDPADEGRFGVPFIEQRADLTVASAIMDHTKMTGDTAEFPVIPKQSPIYAQRKFEAVLKGDEPLMTVVLTHLSDGCAISIGIQHAIVDGQRCIEAYRDLSLCTRGLDIIDRYHDRSLLWPDQLAKTFPDMGEAVANMPRQVLPQGEIFNDPKIPNDTSETVCMIFSPETIQKMKDMVKPFLSEGEYVSTNDVLTAYLWMTVCEVLAPEGEITKGKDIDVDNTHLFMAYEARGNGFEFVPENYSGNAFAMQLLRPEGVELAEAPLAQVFAILAITIRKTLLFLQQQKSIVLQIFVAYAIFEATGKSPIELQMDRFRGIASNMLKAPVKEIDFGSGPPVWSHFQGSPLTGVYFSVAPGFGDGLVCHGQFASGHANRLKTSVVRKTIAPDMKELYNDLSVEELQQQLKK